ncbi:MFS transporter, putative [Paecilomyces variotii No. 5]|uniref:MFS transporter, putative n=1 Tax=Byssochlamys spectabilis (strain No. 5 / NBRC 109023) TaxID=1356009 RepID=V5HX69_BYSSN|nr:MFS transporter, putative [Paecilomyces variotii No. 5]
MAYDDNERPMAGETPSGNTDTTGQQNRVAHGEKISEATAGTETGPPSETNAHPEPDTDPDPNAVEAQRRDSRPAHTAFSKYEKLLIVVMVTLAAFFSPLSGQIYYPVMPTLVKNYNLTTSLVNLTITTYMILQGLAPSFMGTFADSGGRRPAYILAFAIYTGANIGLALQDSYAALMVLRCLQSAGSSGTVAFGFGVISDIATTAERGTYIGPMVAGAMVGPALGPVIGGLLAKFLGWRSVFWFLVIISGGYLAIYIVVMPETARKIVGDGSVPPREWWRMSLMQYIQAKRKERKLSPAQREDLKKTREALDREGQRNRRFGIPNPLLSFKILLEKDACIVIWCMGIIMFLNIAMLTSTANLFPQLYGFNTLQVGLCYIPLGVAACIGAMFNGKLIDFTYRRDARKLGFSIDRKRGDNILHFPIEKCRLQTVFPLLSIGTAAYLPYGWVLQQRTSLAAPLILQFINGLTFIASMNTLNTLLVDLFPDRAATAAAANNLVRCWLGAVGAAVIDYMLSAMGWGWCFVFLGLVQILGMGGLLIERNYGMGWRQKRFERLQEKEKKKEEKRNEREAREQEGKQEGRGDEDQGDTK